MHLIEIKWINPETMAYKYLGEQKITFKTKQNKTKSYIKLNLISI